MIKTSRMGFASKTVTLGTAALLTVGLAIAPVPSQAYAVEDGDSASLMTTASSVLLDADAAAPAQDEQGTYLITSFEDLQWFSQKVRSGEGATVISGTYYGVQLNAKLMADIDLSGKAYMPIGGAVDGNYYCLSGVFDGNEHTITFGSDTTFTETYGNAVVGYLGSNGEVKNLTTAGSISLGSNSAAIVANVFGLDVKVANCVNNATIQGAGHVAGIVYQVMQISGAKVTISNCVNNGSVTSASSNTAGIVSNSAITGLTISDCKNTGQISGGNSAGIIGTSNGKVINCLNTGNINAANTVKQVGGIVAYASAGSVESCANVGNVSGAKYTGGIVGYSANVSYKNCYNTGTVTLSSTVTSGSVGAGGICGTNIRYTGATFENCYNTGAVSGYNAAALIGYDTMGAALTNCYYLEGVAANAANGSAAATTGFASKTSAEMQSAAFAASLGEGYVADAAGESAINGGFPVLAWQAATPEPAAPTVSLSTEATNIKMGDTFTVALTADQALAALQGELAYDGSVLELVKVEAGSGLAFAEGVGGFTATDALFSFWGNTSEEAGAVAVATFKAIKPAAATSVSLEGLVSGASGEFDEVEVAAGEALSLAVGLSGTLGDVNNSGKVNIVDAQVAYDLGAGKYADEALAKLLAHWAEGATVDMVKAFADVNADSAVDATDAFAIQYAVHHNGAFGPATD